MLTSRVIPCLDVRDGRVVKGVKFQGLRDVGSPADLAARYDAQGADEIVMLDITATVRGDETRQDTVRAIRQEISIPLTVGGGVRTLEDARTLLNAGADKVAINSAAVIHSQLVADMSELLGRQCVVVAIDAQQKESDKWSVVTHSGTKTLSLDVISWIQEVESLGAGEILLTSWDRDGTGDGFDLDLLQAARGACRLPIIASGGADSAEHCALALNAGASAVLAASIFHIDKTPVGEVKRDLALRGCEVRLDCPID